MAARPRSSPDDPRLLVVVRIDPVRPPQVGLLNPTAASTTGISRSAPVGVGLLGSVCMRRLAEIVVAVG